MYVSAPSKTKNHWQTRDAAFKSYNQIKRKTTKDNMKRSETARLARIEELGLNLREGTRAIARQTQMFPNKFATNVGHKKIVCKVLESVLGGDVEKLALKKLPMSCQ